MNHTSAVVILGESWRVGNRHDSATTILNSQGYCRFRLFWKYAEIGYFGRLKLFPFQGLTRVHFSLFSENNGFLNIYMLK